MRILRIVRAALLGFSIAVLTGSPVQAQNESFDAYLQGVIAKARAEGVSEATVARMTAGLAPSERVIALDRAQPGTPSNTGSFPPVADYLARHVDAARIGGGQREYAALRPVIRQIEQRYGVPGPILLAIWGHETSYGRVKGNFDLAQALATLAWEGRRRTLFEREFIDLLKVADKGYPRAQLVGSWAGAFGNPQFLPSIYLRLAADGDGDGRADIFTNRVDTLASIANYLRDAGWRNGQPWAVPVNVPASFDFAPVSTRMLSPVCPRVHDRHTRWMTVREWRQRGVVGGGSLRDDDLVSLFQPDGPGTPAWLLTGNYRAILEYNCSNYYAMSVGVLADAIAR